MKTGPLFLKMNDCKKRIIILQGGGDSGKTITALQYLAVDSTQNPNLLTTVTGQDIPNLKGGALRSFQKYVEPDIEPYLKDYNKTDRIYTFKNKSIIEFKSFEDEQDARGSERDNLFVNEANSITYQMFWQLQRKTRRKIILDYNPTSPFYVHERILSGAEKQFAHSHQLYITDHRHNPFLTSEEHAAYESISDPDLFRVYSRGHTGRVKGLIFGHFQKCDAPPEKYDRIYYSSDWGYTNDPTVIIKTWVVARKRYFKELCYEPGLSAESIKRILQLNGYDGEPFYCEHDPNIINQLRVMGLPAQPGIKGPNSVIAGISKTKEFECFYFDSPNLEKEVVSYKWITAQDIVTGKEVMTNQPMDAWNHGCDAIRVGIFTDSIRNKI